MTVNFLIIAAVLFVVVKAMATLKKRMPAPPPPAPAAKPAQEVLLEQIRDLLAKQARPNV